MIKNQNGQTSTEALLALPILVLFISMVFVFFTSIRCYYWIHYQLHEAVICLQDQSIHDCRLEFIRNVNNNLSYTKIYNPRFYQNTRYDSGKVIITFIFLKSIQLEIEKRVYHE